MNIILHNSVRNTCEGVSNNKCKVDYLGLPRGMTALHLMTSFTMASTYGRFSLSAIVGSLLFPITFSISWCALVWTEGFKVIAKKKLELAATVYTTTC